MVETYLALSFMLPAGLGAYAKSGLSVGAELGSQITIRVYDEAEVPAETLTRALKEAARLCSEAGINMLWVECPPRNQSVQTNLICEEPFGPIILGLRVIPQNETKTKSSQNDLFGLALPFEDGGIHASVFYQHSKEFARGGPASVGQVLGHIIAHEIGHLLLWSNAHSPQGIMHGSWSREDLISIATGHLTFTPDETQTIKDNLPRRMRQRQAVEAWCVNLGGKLGSGLSWNRLQSDSLGRRITVCRKLEGQGTYAIDASICLFKARFWSRTCRRQSLLTNAVGCLVESGGRVVEINRPNLFEP
jgi:hypothetical protein